MILLASAILIALPAFAAGDPRRATTTGTDNSELLKFLLPPFEAKCDIKIRAVAVDTD